MQPRQCGGVASIAALDPGGLGSNPTIVKNPFSPSNLEEGTQKSVIRMPFQYGCHWIVAWMLLQFTKNSHTLKVWAKREQKDKFRFIAYCAKHDKMSSR